MSAAKQINANTAVTTALAGANKAVTIVGGKVRELADTHGDKITQLKNKAPAGTKIEIALAAVGLVLIFHGSQFKNLFLCFQVISTFCFGRVKSSILDLYDHVTKASEKTFEGEADSKKEDDPDAKKEPENKHAKKRGAKGNEKSADASASREEDAATAKKMLKAVDTDKVTSAVFEVMVSFMACHMVMEGGVAKTAVVAHALVTATKDKIKAFLDFAEHDDLQVWLDLFLSFVLYCFFGVMAVILSPLAFALNLAIIGAQQVVTHGLRAAEGLGKIPEGQAEEIGSSVKGLGAVGALTAVGTLWQFWALMANSGMAWYFQFLYLPAVVGETLISLL